MSVGALKEKISERCGVPEDAFHLKSLGVGPLLTNTEGSLLDHGIRHESTLRMFGVRIAKDGDGDDGGNSDSSSCNQDQVAPRYRQLTFK